MTNPFAVPDFGLSRAMPRVAAALTERSVRPFRTDLLWPSEG